MTNSDLTFGRQRHGHAHASRSGSQPTGKPSSTAGALFGIVLTTLSLTGCGSFTLVVAKDGSGDAILQYDGFKDCPGTTFEVTITQGGNSAKSSGTVAGGTLKFSGLKDVNPGGLVNITIKAVSGPGCAPKFVLNQTYTTGDTALPVATDQHQQPIKDTYIVDVDKFH